MKNRLISIVMIIIILSFSFVSTYAFWSTVNKPEPKILDVPVVKIGRYPFGMPDNVLEIPEGEIKYDQGDIFFNPDDNTIYETIGDCKKNCLKPGEGEPSWNPKFKTISHKWNKHTIYQLNDIVVQNGRVFKSNTNDHLYLGSSKGPAYTMFRPWLE